MRRLAAALLAVLPTPVLAQAYQCEPPARIAPFPQPKPDGPIRRTAIAGYTLAASWSPEFCRNDHRSMECSGANGRFGFVLHGLWPEAAAGPPPQWCGGPLRPSVELIRRNLCMTPVPPLLEHEWAKHGSCMTRTPEAYYRTETILWRSLQWPDADRLARKNGLTVADLRREFVFANRDWKPEEIGVVLSPGGWLRELRLCYTRDFMPRTCPRQSRGAADSAALKIWRGL